MPITKRDFYIGFFSAAVSAGTVLHLSNGVLKQLRDSQDELLERVKQNAGAAQVNDEIDALRDPSNQGMTREFIRVINKYPDLGSSPLSTCMVANSQSVGSGVYIGNRKIVLCAHEMQEDIFSVDSLPTYGVYQAKAKLLGMDKKLDIAVAEILTPDFSQKHEKNSVKRTEYGTTNPGMTVIAIGSFDGRLHAVEGLYKDLVAHVPINGGSVFDCKIEAQSHLSTWPGMSGGGIFSTTGDFLGMLNAGKVGHFDYTPASVVWNFINGILNKETDNSIEENCRFDRRRLLTSILGSESLRP